LHRFLERGYDSLTEADKNVFARMVDRSNDDLTAWLLNGIEPDEEEFARLASSIRDCATGSGDS
jgi:antitoxin CptB